MENSPSSPAESAQPDNGSPVAAPIDLNLLARESEEILSNLLRLLSFEVKLASKADQESIRIQLQCEDPGRLIGRRGATINELQFLLNRILQRRRDSVPRIFLDVAGSSEKSVTIEKTEKAEKPEKTGEQKTDEQNADNPFIERIKGFADQVHRWGEPVDLGPLNAADRQAVEKLFIRDPEIEAINLDSNADPAKSQRIQLRVRENPAPSKR